MVVAEICCLLATGELPNTFSELWHLTHPSQQVYGGHSFNIPILEMMKAKVIEESSVSEMNVLHALCRDMYFNQLTLIDY
jgi:hypothetical protein